MFVTPAEALVCSMSSPDLVQFLPPSGGLMLFAVVLGLALAIAFQVVLANLGIAIGLSSARPLLSLDDTNASETVKPEPISALSAKDEKQDALLSQGQILSAISVVAGLSLLLTVDSVLFGASFLAVRFSQLAQPLLGITLGLAIWAIYLLLLLTLGGSALGSTAELVLGGAVVSLRRLLDLVKQVLNNSAVQKPALEQEQVLGTAKQQLKELQEDITSLGTQVTELKPSSTGQDIVATSVAQASRPASKAFSKGGEKTGDDPAAIAVATVPQSSSGFDLKAAALSQAVALASTAQTTVADSLQQVKAQVHRQVDDSATALLSSLNQEVQSQAKQAIEQVDLSDWSLESLWNWARHYGHGENRDGSDRPDHNNFSLDASDTKSSLPLPSTESEHFSASSPSADSEPKDLIETPPEVLQVNRDLKNYLKYTSLTKLDQAALGQKLDELLSLWLEGSEDCSQLSPLSGSTVELHTFDLNSWQQALQSRKGIKSDQVQQYMAKIEQKLQVLSTSHQVESEDSGGLAHGLKVKLIPLLDQLNLHELSLEDFKQLVMSLSKDEGLAEGSPIHQADEQGTSPSLADLSNLSGHALGEVADQARAFFTQWDDRLKQTIEDSSSLLPGAVHPLQYLRDRLPNLSDGLVAQLTELPDQTGEHIHQWLEETQGQLGEQIEKAQDALESSLQELQQQAMEQAEQVRHWAAVAAWWLFGLMLSSAIAAGAAGYLAVTSPLLRSF